MTDGAVISNDPSDLFRTERRFHELDQLSRVSRDDPWGDRVITLRNWLNSALVCDGHRDSFRDLAGGSVDGPSGQGSSRQMAQRRTVAEGAEELSNIADHQVRGLHGGEMPAAIKF